MDVNLVRVAFLASICRCKATEILHCLPMMVGGSNAVLNIYALEYLIANEAPLSAIFLFRSFPIHFQ